MLSTGGPPLIAKVCWASFLCVVKVKAFLYLVASEGQRVDTAKHINSGQRTYRRLTSTPPPQYSVMPPSDRAKFLMSIAPAARLPRCLLGH